MKYAIIDVETNGGVKITEICIFIFDGVKVVDEFTTLVNPESNIPPRITSLTGIDNFMVRESPKFHEIAKKVYEITQDCIFVAHNVNFDYGIIGKEFSELGLAYKRKKLCTIRLSRKLLPNKASYSLGKLCVSEGITVQNRHRAKGDVEATVQLFEKLLALDVLHEEEIINSFLNPRSREATLPPLLPKNIFDALSEKHGVYYFWNENKEVIYVGKANNIKQRVLSHFYDKKKKEITMCMATANITYKEMGNELLALLFESAEIKSIYPKFNRAQRRTSESYGLFTYEDRKGIMHLAWNTLKTIPNPIVKFYSASEARSFMERLCEEFQLCPKYCNLQTNVSNCFHYQLKKCKGVCRGDEESEVYNKRVKKAIASVSFQTDNFVIKEAGRSEDEFSYVLFLGSLYKGYGYLKNKKEEFTVDDYLSELIDQKDNRDVNRILQGYIKKNTHSVFPLEVGFTLG